MLSELNGLKQGQRKTEEMQKQFEARMEKKWNLFVKETAQKQRQTQALNVNQPQELDPDEDFEDLDRNFPILVQRNAENFESALRSDLTFKLRMVNYFSNSKLYVTLTFSKRL